MFEDPRSRHFYVLDEGLVRSSGYREWPRCQQRFDCDERSTHLLMWDVKPHSRAPWRTARKPMCTKHAQATAALYEIPCPEAPEGDPNVERGH